MNSSAVPTPFQSMSELFDEGDTTERPFKVFVGNNLGHRVNVMQVPMSDFVQMSAVANDPAVHGDAVSQRKLDMAHASKLAVYILKGLVYGAIELRSERKSPESSALAKFRDVLGPQPYIALQPLVVNIRNCKLGGDDIRARRLVTKEEVTASFEVFLSQQHILWVVDGQHRRKAMELVFDFLDHVNRTHQYPKKGLFPYESIDLDSTSLAAWQEVQAVTRAFCKVSVELHLGLNVEQERQLFHDLNNLGKKVDKNLALKFDNSNTINLFIKDVLHERLGISIAEQDAKDWKNDPGAMAWKDVVAINAILFLNKTNIGGAKPSDVDDKTEIATRFWESVNAIPGFGESGAKLTTVAAQPVVIKALAKLVYDFAFSNRRPSEAATYLERVLSNITEIDFSHDNPMWRYYELSSTQRVNNGLDGLSDYLPSTESGNRDLGGFQDGAMRFGAKHNDIYPVIADMIRWKLDLPSRHKS